MAEAASADAGTIDFSKLSIPADQLEAYRVALDRQLCPQHFYFFAQQAYPVVYNEPYVDGWHIGAMCYHLQALWEGTLRGPDGEVADTLVINLPPGCGKSRICSTLFAGWVWLKNPSAGLWFSSFSQGLCDRDALDTRRLIMSDWYRMRFWPDVYLTDDQNQKRRYNNSRGGWRLSASIESKTGFGEHPHLILCDDPHSPKQVDSAQIEKAKEVWTDTYSTRGIVRGVKSVVTAQRLKETDLSSLVIREGAAHLMIPMEFEPERKCVTQCQHVAIDENSEQMLFPRATWEDPRTEPGELMWPQGMDGKKVAKIKKKLRRAHLIAGQLQQRPSAPEGDQFRKEWFTDPIDLPPSHGRAARGWDKAASTSSRSDYTVGALVVELDGMYYIVDIRRGKWERRRRDKMILATAESDALRYGDYQVLFEREGGGGGKDAAEIAAEAIAREGFKVRIVPSRTKKELRWDALADAFANGIVRLVKGPWNQEFVEEALAAPNGVHDDQLDAVSLAFNKLALSRNKGRVSRDLLLVTPEEELQMNPVPDTTLYEDLRSIFDRACAGNEVLELGVRW